MNPAICEHALDAVGTGVSASLRAVDCAATSTAQIAFGRLFGTDGALLLALQILLTLYIAFFAFSLMLGRSRLSVSALTPRMITLGLVLTFATSWAAYQTYVWNLAIGAPNQIAGILMGTTGSATDIFAQKIDVVFAALIDASDQGAMEGATSAFSPPGLLWLGATLLLLGTVGVLATCKIALAILLALGPIFVVMALFPATRGLFTGWLKGVVMLAFTPLFAVLGGTLMLELSVPVLRKLTETPGAIDPAAAMAFFMIGAVHAALMVIVLKVAGTMVAGWTVFGLSGTVSLEGDVRSGGGHAAPSLAPLLAPTLTEQARAAAPGPSREIKLARAAPLAANDPGAAPGVRWSAPGPDRRHRRAHRSGARRRLVAAVASPRHRQPFPRSPRAFDGEVEMTRALLFAALAPALLAATALAAPAHAQDARLVERLYDENIVVRIEGKAGVQATIRFDEDEHIENVAIGDSIKWQVTPNKRANLLFVKPLEERASTNLTVVTDRHTYLFDLVASPAHRNPLYVLAFTYPEEPEDIEQAAAEGEDAIQPEGPTAVELAAATDPYAVVDPAELNFAWGTKGDGKLLPQRVYDDGNATFMSWAAGTALPAILIKDHKGDEGPVNFAVRGETIVVEGVPREIVLRAGQDSATLTNQGPVRAPRPEQPSLARIGPATAEAK